ncbi:MAG: class I SAM-dependent methyltransferase [Puniceicoccales bacterium]|jgi:2-polyprenyl-3-methyl-5-hydroxy-6-metoxy-1,4-benzoquinol methylase|nr:class I SAM-dependent methyltransferase [Puniceicoccales bacterium]
MSKQEQARASKNYSELLYKTFNPLKACSVFLQDFSKSKDKAQKQAILNRLKDYLRIRKQLSLHYEIARILEAQLREYTSYDYGEGYFYQSCRPIHITGFRNTEARIAGMQLEKYVAGKTVLDIGTNAGFLAIEIAPMCNKIEGFDINPYLIEVANCVKNFLKCDNVEFWAGTFEEFNREQSYEVVLSFANHSTYDHNTRQSTDDYFQKCCRYVSNEGLLLFESHLPSYETQEQLKHVLECLKKYFTIEASYALTRGTRGDQGRTFAICRKR